MPSNLVKTKSDEAAWERAKRATHKQYPDLSEDSDRFWKLCTTIFNSMKDGGGAPSDGDTEKSLAAKAVCEVCLGAGVLAVQYQKAHGPLLKALRECPTCRGSGARPVAVLRKSLARPRVVLRVYGAR
jgi:hypothetical protein